MILCVQNNYYNALNLFCLLTTVSTGHRRMEVHWAGIVAIVVFYLVILAVGIWAARKSKQTGTNPDSEDVMLAGRNIGAVVGVFTMTG